MHTRTTKPGSNMQNSPGIQGHRGVARCLQNDKATCSVIFQQFAAHEFAKLTTCAKTADTSHVFGGGHTASAAESGADRTDLDLRVSDLGLRRRLAQVRRLARAASGARPAQHTRLARSLISGPSRVQPEHVHVRVIPERQDEHHATVQRLAHALQGTLRSEMVEVTKLRLLFAAELVRDGVASVRAQDSRLRVLDDLAVLHVEAFDL
mmetsp:Transcript_94983/g.255504  ORF Transcript_94983/g.255504 Transcript_94983/m.255504 type:complete len:208 (+) Transcript_94983:179-802(+)